MADLAPHLGKVNAVQRPLWLNGEYMKAFAAKVQGSKADTSRPLASAVENFFQTDAISRASTTLAKALEIRRSMRVQSSQP